MRRPLSRACGVIGLCALMAAVLPTKSGSDTFWQHEPASTGDWYDAANWSAGVPSNTLDPIIDNGGTAHIGSGSAVGRNIFIGYNNDGTLMHDGGTLSSVNGITIAQFDVSTGHYDIAGSAQVDVETMNVGQNGMGSIAMSGGNLNASGHLQIGVNGAGTFMHTGGAVNVLDGCCSGRIDIGWGVGSSGVYELTAPATLVTETLHVGLSGTGEFVQNGSLVNPVNLLVVGFAAGSDGTYTLSGGGTVQCNRVDVGAGANGGTGLFIHQDGDVTAANGVIIGGNSGSLGTYQMQSGTLNTVNLGLGVNGVGVFEQTGGVVTIDNSIGMYSQPGGDGSLLIAGGQFSATTMSFGGQGDVLFRQTGGEASIGEVSYQPDVGGTATFEMMGGVLHLDLFDGGGLVNAGGTLAPGQSFGTTTIEGGYTQGAGGTLHIEIGGVFAGTSFDLVEAGGPLQLAGTLEVELVGGFVPLPVNEFVFLTGTSRTGMFGNAPSQIMAGGGTFDVVYGPNSVRLKSFAPPPLPPVCPGDLDLSDDVTVTDLLELLAQWGQCPEPCTVDAVNGPDCQSDINRDCNVNVTDLLSMLSNWGPCPIPTDGACVLADGGCQVTTEITCAEMGGLSWAGGGTCQDTDGDRLPDAFELADCSAPAGLFVGTNPFDGDTDGDGISDGDEMMPTTGGLNLPAIGANPLRSTIFVEVDWMNDSIDFSHSHQPTAEVVATLVDLFDQAAAPNLCGADGVDFIVDYGQGGQFTGGNLIGGDTVVVFPSEFDAYKAVHFDSARAGYFHYAIFCHRYNSSTNNSSGFAEINGDDFIVSLQSFLSHSNVTKTFLHELGHNLGLRHGGFEDRNFKPNYNSVMNYRYQFAGIDANCNGYGDGYIDLSHGTNGTLDEVGLSEYFGICGGVSIDWDGNGVIDTRGFVIRNINCEAGVTSSCGAQPAECYDFTCDVLQDYNDWINLDIAIPPAGQQRRGPEQTVTCQDTPRITPRPQ